MLIFQSAKRINADQVLEDSFFQSIPTTFILLLHPLYLNHLHAHILPLFPHHLYSPYLLPLPYKTTPILL